MKKIALFLLSACGYLFSSAQTTGAMAFYTANYATVFKKTNYGNIVQSGAIVPAGIAGRTSADYVHIFMDENGNLISDNLPNGVPWVTYVVHIIHPIVAGESFGVTQTSGTVSGAFIIQNAAAPPPGPGAPGLGAPALVYGETVNTLSPSDKDNISFQVAKTKTVGANTTKTAIGTYTLIMSGYFNASLDLGIINSKLANPTYTLLNSPATANEMVVKQSDAGDRTLTTIMGTIYFSPVAWFERLADKNNVPLFKVKGRSSLEDHRLLERIYPTFGLAINEHSFQNIFYGVNWEIIHGGSLFLGWHTGKINTYTNTTPGFTYGTTAVTQDQFNYQQDTKWATKFAIGATVDLRLVLGLLSTQIK